MTELLVRSLGIQPYGEVWQAMREFTDTRDETTPDELWVVEHSPVFTLGQAGKREHILRESDIPIVASDRGGQVTYHGPGQLVIYLLLDLRRKGLGVRDLVSGIENAIIKLLQGWDIAAQARKDAPGVYVEGRKIAALGLRVRRGRSYHGLSLNVAMDLTPFEAINPCGYEGLEVTQLREFGVDESVSAVAQSLVNEIKHTFRYDSVNWCDGKEG
ncbi:MAG: lipoyl(octanoyl) transferase [Candidatus Azotimanducaceae bacterium]